jgi:hypothetical protein
MRSRAGARRAPPRSSTKLRPRAAPRARPTTVRARPQAGQVRRPEDPTPAARRRVLPTTEAVLRGKRREQQARPATRAQAVAARPQAAAEAAQLRGAEEAALPRPAAEAARLPVDQAVAEHRARPSPETALLSGAARPRSMSARYLVNLPAARWRPTKARVGPSPTSVAHPGWARRLAGPSSGWRPAAEAPGRPSTRPIPVAELRPAEPRSAPQAAAGSAGSPSQYATVMRAGQRSCSSCP